MSIYFICFPFFPGISKLQSQVTTPSDSNSIPVIPSDDDPFGSAPFSLPPALRDRTALKKSGGKA